MKQTRISVRHQTHKQRMKRIKRNVQIRKQKLYGIHVLSEQSTEFEHKEPCKQDKSYQQKLKNRQAAQKSREEKKQYTIQLEEELRRLKHIIGRCSSCSNQLQNAPSEVDNTRDDSASRHLNETDSMADEIPQMDNSFYRMRSSSEDSSIGIYLFIFMIIIGIFCVGTRLDSSGSEGPHKRDLMQFNQLPKNEFTPPQNVQDHGVSSQLQPIHSFQTNMNPTYSTHSQIDVDPANYQNGLLSMDQVKSPASISDDKVFAKIITAFENYKLIKYQDKNLRSKNSLIDANKSLLFCTQSKIYKADSNHDGILTPFIDIFVQGVEIVNFLQPEDTNSLTNNGFQLNGLYKITASVEEITEISNPSLIY